MLFGSFPMRYRRHWVLDRTCILLRFLESKTGRCYAYFRNMSLIFYLLLFVCHPITGITVVCPPYPPLAIRGGNVVAVLELSKGSVGRVIVLYGDKPFVEPARAALAKWRLPREREDKPTLVVVNFRDPYLTMDAINNGIVLGTKSSTIKTDPYPQSLPIPTLVVDPFYGSHSRVVMGASVLHLKIAENGSVGEVRVIQELGDHTQPTIDAVKKWKFLPAQDEGGKPVASDAFAVCVYRPLVQTPQF